MAGAETRRAHSLDEVRTFLLEEFNSEPIHYCSEISLRRRDSCKTVTFDCVLERRRRELVDASLILEIASVEVLVGVVKALVNCSTWTHAKFEFGFSGFGYRDLWSDRVVFERGMFEVFHLLRSSPSLLRLDVSCNVTFRALVETVAGGVSHNSALKSLSLHTSDISCYDMDVKSLEVLFTSASMISVKELVLRFLDCVQYNYNVANVISWKSNLEKLTLCSTNPTSAVKNVTYAWASDNHGRALQVKYSGLGMYYGGGMIQPIISKFTQDYNSDSIFPRGTDISTLHLILSFDYSAHSCNSEWVHTFRDDMIGLVTSVATMSARSTTLKHVLMSFDWGRDVHDQICRCRKQVELSTLQKLREMVGNELRGNTSLETLEVGYSKLIRLGQHVGGGADEWLTSYRGPCLRYPSNEYVVKVQM